MMRIRLSGSLVLVLMNCIAFAQPGASDAYEIVRQDERIFLYERWADFPGTTTKARGLKVIFTVAASFDKMVTMVTEEEKIQEWQKNLAEFKRYPKNDTAWHVYTWYKMPWPLTDQDYYAKYNIPERTASRIVIAFGPAVNDKAAPAREKINRMKAYGRWVLEKTATGKTKVTYFITGEPVNMPRSVTDNIVRNNFMSTMNTLITVAETN
jgi:hypothetical protein